MIPYNLIIFGCAFLEVWCQKRNKTVRVLRRTLYNKLALYIFFFQRAHWDPQQLPSFSNCHIQYKSTRIYIYITMYFAALWIIVCSTTRLRHTMIIFTHCLFLFIFFMFLVEIRYYSVKQLLMKNIWQNSQLF